MQCFLEQSDLTSMIKLMLHDSAEHVIKIVIIFGLAGNLILEARVGKTGNRFGQFVVSLLKVAQCSPPGGWARVLHERKILLVCKFDGCATDAPGDSTVP